MAHRIRRLFLDIETSPNIGLFWRPGRMLSIGHENIIKERAIICAGWKWEDSKRIHAMTWDSRQSDKKLVKKLVSLLHRCDEVVAHNGDRFDIRWVRGRALFHGLRVNPFVTTVDTLKIARKYFELNSHRLDYIGKFLGMGGKIPTGFDLWRRILIDKDSRAMAEMVEYNKRDVQLLADVYAKLNTYFPAKSRVTGDMRECPSCRSFDLVIRNYRTSAAGRKSVQLSCKKCGKYCTMPASKFED